MALDLIHFHLHWDIFQQQELRIHQRGCPTPNNIYWAIDVVNATLGI
jgi:hypothetical protein